MTVQFQDTVRKRKSHRKSRRGCGNCKLRRVKCDETKPECRRCMAFGVSCSYEAKISDLDSSMTGAFQVEIPKNCSLDSAILNMINVSQERAAAEASVPTVYYLHQHDLQTLQRFRYRTVLCIGTDRNVHLYRDNFLKMASGSPFLMHLILTLTMMHDRYYTGPKQSASEAFHWFQGTALFNSLLSKPIDPGQRDAGAAAILGCIAFPSIEGYRPEEVWPLKPPSILELDWLKISDGKKAIWRIADPLREDSIFAPLATEMFERYLPHKGDMEDLPVGFVELFELDDKSSPYYETAQALARIIDLDCNRRTVLNFVIHWACEWGFQAVTRAEGSTSPADDGILVWEDVLL